MMMMMIADTFLPPPPLAIRRRMHSSLCAARVRTDRSSQSIRASPSTQRTATFDSLSPPPTRQLVSGVGPAARAHPSKKLIGRAFEEVNIQTTQGIHQILLGQIQEVRILPMIRTEVGSGALHPKLGPAGASVRRRHPKGGT